MKSAIGSYGVGVDQVISIESEYANFKEQHDSRYPCIKHPIMHVNYYRIIEVLHVNCQVLLGHAILDATRQFMHPCLQTA